MIVTTRGADPTTKNTMKDLGMMVSGVIEDHFDVRKEVSLLVKYMDVNDCKNAIYFEISKRASRLWVAVPERTLRFEIVGQQSVFDLSTLANYHKGTGHAILFSKDFEESERLQTTKAVLERAFKPVDNTPIERAVCFFYVNGLILMRNYLIKGVVEIGPRIEMRLDRIFDGCFKGKRMYDNVEQ